MAEFPLFAEQKQKWEKMQYYNTARDAEVAFCKYIYTLYTSICWDSHPSVSPTHFFHHSLSSGSTTTSCAQCAFVQTIMSVMAPSTPRVITWEHIPGERPAPSARCIRHVWASSSLLTRLQSLSHLLLSGECSPHTSWTYMYQGFDISAIFSCRRPLEVVIMMSRRL